MRFNLMLPFLVLSVTLERPKPADVALPAADYNEKDPWTPRVAAAASTLGEHFSTDEILDRLDLAPEERGQVVSRRVGRILGHLGYQSKVLRIGEVRTRRWMRAAPATAAA